MGWGLMLERGQGLLQVLEQVQEAAQAYRAKAEVLHQEAAEEVQVGQQEVASLAWARGLPCSWISSLCADPTDSPRPKGWETTLEPYRMLNLVNEGSQRTENGLKRV